MSDNADSELALYPTALIRNHRCIHGADSQIFTYPSPSVCFNHPIQGKAGTIGRVEYYMLQLLDVC